MVVLLAIVYNVPSFFEHEISNVSNDCLSRVEPQLVYSRMRTSRLYFIVYKTAVYFLCRFLFPLASLTYLNARLVYILRRQFNQQQLSVTLRWMAHDPISPPKFLVPETWAETWVVCHGPNPGPSSTSNSI